MNQIRRPTLEVKASVQESFWQQDIDGNKGPSNRGRVHDSINSGGGSFCGIITILSGEDVH